jgi:hypothetical protein
MQDNQKRSEIAVSEVVGFIIILGIMMTGIALVTLYGYPTLIKEQANANIKNMERNMIVLQNDIKSLAYKSVPYQETMIQIGDGTLIVNKSNSDAKSFVITDFGTFKPGELQLKHSSEDAVISMETGAVIVSYWNQGGSAMLSEPRWFIDTDASGKKTFVISLVNISADSDLAKTGTADVQLKLMNSSTSVYTPPSGGIVDITYNHDITNDHRTAWSNYLKYSLGMTQQADPKIFEITGIDKLIVKTYDVKVVGI